MEEWQERVLQEHKELSDKVNKLTNYLAKDNHHEEALLWIQLKAMRTYKEILTARIKEFS